MKKYSRNQKGYTLAVLVVIIAIAVVTGLALLGISVNEFSNSVREQNRIKAYYIAKAGASAMEKWMNESGRTREQVKTLIDANMANTNPSNVLNGKCYVHFGGNQFYPVIYSRGVFRENDRLAGDRTVILELAKRGFIDSAILVTNALYIQSTGSYVNGNITLVNNGEVTHLPTNWTGQTAFNREFFDFTGVSAPYNPKDNATAFVPSATYHPEWIGTYDYVFDTDIQSTVYLDPFVTNNIKIHVTGTTNRIFKLYSRTMSMKGSLTTDAPARTVVLILDGGSMNLQTPSTGSSEFQAVVYAPFAQVDISANITGSGSIFGQNINIQSGGGITFDPSLGGLYPEELGYQSFGYRIVAWRNQ